MFPRAVLELMRTPEVRSIHASAVEVYHENVFDLMNGREQLSLGSSRTKFGRRARGAAESGSDDVAGDRGAQGGVHPSCCTCHKCFAMQEKEKARAAAESSSRTSLVPKATSIRRETFDATGATTSLLDTPESLARFARSVEATRTSGAHFLNDRSSRSHCLVRVFLKKRKRRDRAPHLRRPRRVRARRAHGRDGRRRARGARHQRVALGARESRQGARGDVYAKRAKKNTFNSTTRAVSRRGSDDAAARRLRGGVRARRW